MPQEIIFAQMLQELMNEKFRRNRSALAQTAHISPSALSQYVRGRATPSLEVLVHLADALGVSLDFLIFGRERVAPAPELGYLAGHLETHMRAVESQSASLQALVARLGSRLGEQIREIAEDLLPSTTTLAGMLNHADINLLERCSSRTTIITRDLSREVLILSQQDNENVAAPSTFSQLVADNIRADTDYEYVVPDGKKWRETATLLKQELIRLGGIDAADADQHLHFFFVNSSCVPGFIVQHVSMERLHIQGGHMLEIARQYAFPDPSNRNMCFIAYTEPANANNEYFSLVGKENVAPLLDDLRELRSNVTRPHRHVAR